MVPNYFIIGTKYAGWTAEPRDVFPDMLEAEAVSIGYSASLDLGPAFGADEETVREYLTDAGIEGDSFHYLRKLASVKPGDMIALKKVGSPVGRKARLLVCGYAVVVRRDGVVYRHEPEGLGHLINVDFVERDIAKEFGLGYGQTIHRLTQQDHIEAVFGPYVEGGSAPKRPLSRGTRRKATGDTERSVSGGKVKVSKAHDRMQQSLFDHLAEIHGTQNVRMEVDGVDILLQIRGEVTLFEVKPHMSVTLCIREALGQLLEYSWRLGKSKPVKELVVVGYAEMTQEEEQYFEYVRSSIGLPLRYRAWPHA